MNYGCSKIFLFHNVDALFNNGLDFLSYFPSQILERPRGTLPSSLLIQLLPPVNFEPLIDVFFEKFAFMFGCLFVYCCFCFGFGLASFEFSFVKKKQNKISFYSVYISSHKRAGKKTLLYKIEAEQSLFTVTYNL